MLKTLCKTTLKNSGVLPWMLCALFLSTTTSAYSTATNAALTGQDSEAFTKVKNIVDDPGANREQMEGALQTLKKMTEKYSQDPFIKTYYALALATQPKYEAKIQNKQLYEAKANREFEEIMHVYPDYAFVYAARGLSEAKAPAFLNRHESAQRNFELGLKKLPEQKSSWNDADWEAYAISLKFYPDVLQTLIEKGTNSKANRERLTQIRTMAESFFSARK